MVVSLGLPAAKDGLSQWTSAQRDTTRHPDCHILSHHLRAASRYHNAYSPVPPSWAQWDSLFLPQIDRRSPGALDSVVL